MATYTVTADSYPDYDEDWWDDYWKLPEWQLFYDKLVEKYGATEGSKRWLDAWWRNDLTSHPVLKEMELKDWAMAKGLWNNQSFNTNKSRFFKPSEFVPPYTPNQGQVVTTIDPNTNLPKTETIGVQPDLQAEQKAREEKKAKRGGNALLIGGGIILIGLTVVYFVIRRKNRAQ